MRLHHHRTGTGEPLVLIHGLGSHWQMWTPVLAPLAAHHDLIALDLPGFGQSPMPPPQTPAGVDSLATLVTDFLTELGVQRPHVAGNSLGGMVALELARRGDARSACALSPAGFYTAPERWVAQTTLRLTAATTRALVPRADAVTGRPGLRRLLFATFMAHAERMPREEAAASIRAFAGAPWFDATLEQIAGFSGPPGAATGVPVTIGWGAKDRLLYPWQARRAIQAIPTAQLVKLTGCGHLPTFDDPQQVARVILETTGAQTATTRARTGAGVSHDAPSTSANAASSTANITG